MQKEARQKCTPIEKKTRGEEEGRNKKAKKKFEDGQKAGGG